MFQKLNEEKLKKRTSLKNQLYQKLRESSIKSMPPIESIIEIIFPKKKPIIAYNLENHVKLYSCEGKACLVELGSGEVFPFIKLAIDYPGLLPCVYVDEGAVKPLLRGVDLMAPGIKSVPQEFEENTIIEIRLLQQSQPFAIGITSVSSKHLEQNKTGLAIRNLHYLRDGLYSISNEL